MIKKLFDKENFKFDYLLLGLIIALNIISVVMVHSASYYNAKVNFNNPFYYTIKQIIGVSLGFVFLLVFYFMNLEFLDKARWYILIVSIVLLVLVFIPIFSTTKYGATRWLNLGFVTIQPSEIAKFAYIVFSSSYLYKNQDKIKTFKGILPIIIVGLIYAVLIILEPNMSITVCMGLLMLSFMLIGGAKIKHILVVLVPIMIILPLLIILEPYRLLRLMAFLNPWASPKGEGYQLIQSLYALSNGGLFGVGLFNSRQKFNFLPFAESDFIFAIIGEELGFFGCFFISLIYIAVIYRGVIIAVSSVNKYYCFLASGITSIIAIQVLVNIAVVTGTIPPTGLPLPFISSGSTSIITFMSFAGILLNISRQKNKNFVFAHFVKD